MAGTTIQPLAEPIAIIGRSCRLPGAPSPDAYWDLLRDGRSGVRDLPASRLRPGGRGGFLDGIDEFDPEFFGISVREAGAMDPQQRLMLELSWEALEDAGIVPAALHDSDTGIYVGAMSSDYLAVARDQDVSHYSITGLTRSLIANRVSHLLGLHGASLTVDAGQASSLVAVHLACQSLRGGETGLALAGGVELSFAGLSRTIAERSGALSPDGECFTFDARANGFVRGEGAGIIVLKPLAGAIADQDHIRAVILGSAVNNDGGGKELGVPTEAAQREVLRLACERAGVAPVDVQYVELHGTGTSVGDPVEAAALGAVYGSARPPGHALPVGSAKTNVGHLGSAAGIAGLLKVTLAIEHGQLPPSRNFVTPNPAIPLDELNLTVQDTLGERAPNLAGVSAFSIGGTNCHVLLADPPARPGADGPARAQEPLFRAGVTPLTICGHSAAAVRAQARRLREHADANPRYSLPELGFSLAVARTAFRHRAVILATTREELREELTALDAGTKSPAQVSEAAGGSGRPVFVFPATVPPRAGLAASLLDSSDTFRASVRATDEAMRGYLGWSVEALLLGQPGTPRPDSPHVTGPMAFAVQVGLASVWRSFGVDPAAVVGEGAGLIAAAHVAGGLSLATAARLACPGDGTPDLPPLSSAAQISIRTCGAGLGPAIASLAGHRAFIEISLSPVLATELRQEIEDAGSPAVVIESSCDGVHAPRALLGALATFHVTAGTVDWRPAFPPRTRTVSLPAYPFQRRRCWLGSQTVPVPRQEQVVPWVVSAPSQAGLRGQAGRLRQWLAGAGAGQSVAEVGRSLAASRAAPEHRAVVLAADRESGLAGLAALASGDPAGNLVTGTARAGRVVLVFPGQGSQWAGMGVELAAESPVFAELLEEAGRALAPYTGWELASVLGDKRALGRVEVVQPALFAVMVALAGLWRHHRGEPAAVLGHSQGEIAAACVAGALSVQDAAKVVALRSRALARLAGHGGMVSVSEGPDAAAVRIAGWGERLALAVVNGPESVVVSGDPDALAALIAACEADGVRARPVPVDYASHSAQVEQIRDVLAADLAGIIPRAPRVPMWSTVTGGWVDGAMLDAGYWYANLRQPVRFGPAVEALAAAGYTLLIEASPHPVLAAAAADASVAMTGSLRRDDGGPARFAASLAQAWVNGAAVDWKLPPGRLADLPASAFSQQPDRLDPADAGERSASGPLTAAEMLAVIQAEAAAVLGADAAEDIEPDRAFRELGFGSITEVELAGRLAARTGFEIRPTDIFGHPSPARLARHLHASAHAPSAHRARSADRARTAADPVAIVSMACRYPGGVESAEDLWRLAMAGDEAMSGFPVNRGWNLDELLGSPGRPGTSAVREGGFLHDADEFDAGFFGIGPREATAMDPQQRLLLQVAWEAIERAGIRPVSLRGTRCGVFVGAMPQEYGPRMHEAPRELAGHLLTGSTTSVLSGRLAYTFGLNGPAVTVDTACSSSLVALHLAATAVRQGECSLALVAGVTVMSSPGMFIEFSRQHGLAPDGRCKPFAAAANGTAWSEGVAVLAIERVADAARNNHPVLAIIRGSATNQDGASNGLTAPNGPAQEEVIRQALASAGLNSADVDAVEAHGTGTPLGDPIEARAVLATYGQDRPPDRPLLLGSVKSHVGHTQAAAGIAGVITMVQSIRHGLLPATAHLDAPSPHVNWTAGAVTLLTGNTRWPDTGRPKRAGVSSFGISGTNAHVIIEEAPPDTPAAAGTAPDCLPWPITARDGAALRDMAGRLRAHVDARGDDPARVSFSLATTRAIFERRAVTVARDAPGHLAALDALAAGQQSPALITGRTGRRGPLAVMLAGQGSQRAGMGRELYRAYPVFAEAFDEACAAIRKAAGPALPEVVFASPGSTEADLLEQTSYTQPALFALEISLYRLITSFGLRADYLIGHSVGELTAACLASVLSLQDAAALVCARGALMQALPKTGTMVSLRAAESEILPLLEGHEEEVSISAVNGRAAVVISGTAQVVDGIAARWRESGGQARRLRVSHAFHSPLMNPILENFHELAAGLSYSEPAIPIVSNVTGRLAEAGEVASPEYWTRHIRAAVRFHDGIRHLADLGVARYIELGPGTALANLARRCLGPAAGTANSSAPDQQPVITSALAAGQPDTVAFLAGLARLYVSGTDIDWRGCFAGAHVKPVELPPYPFRRARFWIDGVHADAGQAATAGPASTAHPLLPGRVDAADGSAAVLTGDVSAQTHPWLADHVVLGEVLFPGTGFLELALHAARRSGTARVEELALEVPLALPPGGTTEIQLVAGPESRSADAARRVSIHARSGPSRPWTRHASGAIGSGGNAAGQLPRESWPPAGAEAIDVAEIYDRLTRLGYGYGPAFRGLRAAWRGLTEVFAEVALPPDQRAAARRYQLHPALIDAALHAAVGLMLRPETNLVRVPFCWSGVTLYAPGPDALLVRMSQEGADVITMMLTDLTGAPVASVERLVLRPVPVPSANAGTRPRDDQPATARTAPATLSAELAELPEAGQRRRLLTLVLTGTAGALGYESPDPIRADQGFLDAGLDSLGAVELREVLTDATGLSLPETVAFDHSTPQALAEYLWLALCRDDADQSPPPMTDPRPVDLSSATNEEIFDFIDNDLGVS